MDRGYEVALEKMIEKMDLVSYTPEIDISELSIHQSEINRPALQLSGFFERFAQNRVQIIGRVEHTYIEEILEKDRLKMLEVYEQFFNSKIPCVVFARGLKPTKALLYMSEKYQVPLLGTNLGTSEFMAELIRWLNEELAPRISIHGVLVDVFGEGVLIMGESGIGKSEAALELIKRGHRLVSDDVVEIKRISKDTLVGSAPEITRHFIELRGIGIIDVKTLYGVESVKMTQNIDMVIQLDEWDKGTDYDRLGLEEKYTEFLGNKVVSHQIPIRPGRNLAIIVESAAINHRQKKMGYNAAKELYNRVTGQFAMED
ncbi:MAG: HPr(Ser) kinase/phosphatase [Lachnospiraceae bacterium]|nr:HPr(Ser) kinase/phosphatase [Lachnospiraceae bacterium]